MSSEAASVVAKQPLQMETDQTRREARLTRFLLMVIVHVLSVSILGQKFPR
jgi:hypothetical protein